MKVILTGQGIADHEPSLELSAEDMEWILNSLRLMQNRQQQLSSEGALIRLEDRELIPDSDIPIPNRELTADDIQDFFRVQFNDVTDLRERLVQFLGRDLTDG